MQFEWDERKNLRNQEKHGISFELATGVFLDPNLVVESSYSDPKTGEPRWLVIGRVPEHPKELVVIYVNRDQEWTLLQGGEEAEEVIRIISARKADPRERRRYQKL